MINVRSRKTKVLLINSSKSIQDVDYCPHLEKLFWAEENAIRAAKLTDATPEIIVNSKGNLVIDTHNTITLLIDVVM